MLRDYRNPRRRRGAVGLRKCLKRIAENFPNLGKRDPSPESIESHNRPPTEGHTKKH